MGRGNRKSVVAANVPTPLITPKIYDQLRVEDQKILDVLKTREQQMLWSLYHHAQKTSYGGSHCQEIDAVVRNYARDWGLYGDQEPTNKSAAGVLRSLSNKHLVYHEKYGAPRVTGWTTDAVGERIVCAIEKTTVQRAQSIAHLRETARAQVGAPVRTLADSMLKTRV